MSVLQKLTEGVVTRDVRKEGAALLTKWEATGLLEGLNEGQAKQGMAVLLENQAKELLREASSMAAGDVEGFAAVAFPIVRRVFGGLIANDLVSVQPMSLPSGLIFFLDFTHTLEQGDRLGAQAGASVYGGNVVASELTGGVSLGNEPGGFYDLGHGGASPTGSIAATKVVDSGDALGNAFHGGDGAEIGTAEITQEIRGLLRHDADILAMPASSHVKTVKCPLADFADGDLNREFLSAITLGEMTAGDTLVRRLTKIVGTDVVFTVVNSGAVVGLVENDVTVQYPIADQFDGASSAVGAVLPQDIWGLEEPTHGTGNAGSTTGKSEIAEIDIKVDSIAVTAQTKKLKAKWSPELGQDLNAYHNLDAEVELTGILSEQIALEIDRELLGELVNGATAGTRYWSRAPGLFVDSSGAEIGATSAAPDFTGTVSEWYETLIETINDVSAQIHRKTLRGGANFVVCSPEVANILEFTSGFRASVTADQDRGTIGAVKAGSLSKKFDVYVDPYFLRNVVLVGRKGSSFLESGFVYAPYVPLQVTPTIFGTEDFVPRKGVMTRYAKKMVRPDMYGLVVVRGLLGESGG